MILNDIAAHRLQAQQLNGSAFKKAADLVKWFGAIQGQEYAQSKWGIGLRLPQLDDKAIEKEIHDGKIIRTHLLRPTWHLVAAADLRWLLMLTAPRVSAINAYMYRKMELNETIFKRCHGIFEKALQGNKQLTRDELSKALKEHRIEAEGVRLVCILMHAELAALICSGKKQGNQFSYALIEERVPPAKEKTRDEALLELTKRYFKSRGPATLKDFSTWSGLSLSDCKKGMELSAGLFSKEILDKETYYFEAAELKPLSDNHIHLLPIYDELIMGYKNRDAILQFKHDSQKSFTFDNTILVAGQIMGTWRRTMKPKAIELEYQLLKPLSGKQNSEFKKRIDRFGEFYMLPVHSVKK
jgi:hypothetical protein